MALFNKGMRKLKGDSASHGASMNGPSITGPLMTKGVRRGITYPARKKRERRVVSIEALALGGVKKPHFMTLQREGVKGIHSSVSVSPLLTYC